MITLEEFEKKGGKVLMSLLDGLDLCTQVMRKIPDELSFMCFIGTLVDLWCADHDIDAEHQQNMILTLNEVRNQILHEIGPMKKEVSA